MPPLIVAVGILALGYYGVKAFKAAKQKAQEDLEAVRNPPSEINAGTLKQDPVTGDYKPTKD